MANFLDVGHTNNSSWASKHPYQCRLCNSNDDFAVWVTPFLPHNRCKELLFVPSIAGIASSVGLCLERLEETEVGSVAVLTPSLATTGNSTYVLATAVRSR